MSIRQRLFCSRVVKISEITFRRKQGLKCIQMEIRICQYEEREKEPLQSNIKDMRRS